MKSSNRFSLLFIALALFSLPAFAWNCSVPGQVRVQVPTGTAGSGTGDGSGQVVVDNGLTFECEALPTASTPSSTSTSTSSSNSTATGGNASSTATGGSSNQKQKQSQSSTNNNQSAGGSVSDVGNSQTTVEAPKIPVNTAEAPPVFSTANCFKGFSAGGQTAVAGLSFGGGGIDKNCAAERIAQDYFAMGNRLAACKVIITTKASKDGHVSLDDCLNVPHPAPRVLLQQAPTPAAAQPVSVTVNVPPPAPVIILHETLTVRPTAAQLKKYPVHKTQHRPCPVTPIQNACPLHEK